MAAGVTQTTNAPYSQSEAFVVPTCFGFFRRKLESNSVLLAGFVLCGDLVFLIVYLLFRIDLIN